jgi:hypothetical protein
VVSLKPFALEQDAEASISKPAALWGELPRSLTQGLIVAGLFLMPEGRAIEIDQSASPAFTQAMRFYDMAHNRSFYIGHQKFFVASSFNATLSSMASANRRFSLELSSCRGFYHLAFESVMSP